MYELTRYKQRNKLFFVKKKLTSKHKLVLLLHTTNFRRRRSIHHLLRVKIRLSEELQRTIGPI